MKDFVRQLPGSDLGLARQGSFLRSVHCDGWLLVFLFIVAAIGLITQYSTGGESLFYVKRQALFLTVAFAVMMVVANIPISILKRWSPLFYLACLIALVLVLLIGVGAKGAQRWLSLGFIRFQPSELMKLALPIVLAYYFSTRTLPPKFIHVLVSLFLLALPTALILRQPDLGTSILIATSGLVVVFLAGLAKRYIFGSLAVLGAAAWPIWQFVMKDYQKQRVLTLLDPEADRLGSGWNIWQSKTAIGSGGLDGKGWLKGTQSQLDFLPEGHTDFAIAALAEEQGFFGVIFVMFCYLLIISRGMWISMTATTSFGRLLAGSITLTFFMYVFVNIGMVSGILPVVGVPLPLISYGGTSLVTLLAGFGLLMSIATQDRRRSKR